jgi:hypothetical protein
MSYCGTHSLPRMNDDVMWPLGRANAHRRNALSCPLRLTFAALVPESGRYGAIDANEIRRLTRKAIIHDQTAPPLWWRGANKIIAIGMSGFIVAGLLFLLT